MLKAERQAEIRQLLEDHGTATVADMALALGVSDMTIRRDLEELAAAGTLERVHGGARSRAKAQPPTPREYSHLEKRSRNMEAKRVVAAAAAGLIGESSTVFLGTGTTVEQLVPLLPKRHMRVITNSLSACNLLEGREDYELCLVGGLYRRSTSAFVGPLAEEAVAQLGIDVAFVGVNGVADGSVFTSNMEEGKFQRLVLDKAARSYLVGDASKLGRRDFYSFYQLADATGFVCDSGARKEDLSSIREHTELIVGNGI